MIDKELCDFIAKVETAYSRRLLKSWERDPESFPEYLRQLEEVIDLKAKICLTAHVDK